MRKPKWPAEALAHALSLREEGFKLRTCIEKTCKQFHLPPVSTQYLSKAYLTRRAGQEVSDAQ